MRERKGFNGVGEKEKVNGGERRRVGGVGVRGANE